MGENKQSIRSSRTKWERRAVKSHNGWVENVLADDTRKNLSRIHHREQTWIKSLWQVSFCNGMNSFVKFFGLNRWIIVVEWVHQELEWWRVKNVNRIEMEGEKKPIWQTTVIELYVLWRRARTLLERNSLCYHHCVQNEAKSTWCCPLSERQIRADDWPSIESQEQEHVSVWPKSA
jgi:hypothetical protein